MKANDKSVLLRVFGAAIIIFAAMGIAGCGKTYSRDDFNKLVVNKSESEVKSAVGEPAWINDGKPTTWIYHSKTFDAANQNKSDSKASLTFGPDAAGGQEKVIEVRYE